jgi:hypothetical protein
MIKKLIKGDGSNQDKVLTYHLNYGLPEVMKKVKKLGFDYVKQQHIKSPKRLIDVSRINFEHSGDLFSANH